MVAAAGGQSVRADFEPLARWRANILSGDVTALRAMYSATVPPEIASKGLKGSDPKDEVKFWSSLQKKGLTDLVFEDVEPRPSNSGFAQTVFQAVLTFEEKSKKRRAYVGTSLIWMVLDGQWRIVLTQRSEPNRLKLPTSRSEDLYPAGADAEAELNSSLSRAAATGKHVLVVFGANWCYDCHILEAAFRLPEVRPLLEGNFEVVHVDIGNGERNGKVALRCGVSLQNGVPALAVLDAQGKVLFGETGGKFQSITSRAPEDIIDFLNRWQAKSGVK
jgi:hypothetical protein